jgi:hypothetical protein
MAVYSVFVPGTLTVQVASDPEVGFKPTAGTLFQGVTASTAAAALAAVTGTAVSANRSDQAHVWLTSNDTLA